MNYQPGRFLVASRDEAPVVNEQSTLTIEGAGGTVVFSLIAGLIRAPRRLLQETGDEVKAGERIGLIKFGSRVDILLGNEWKTEVRLGERVRAGSSVLARRKDV